MVYLLALIGLMSVVIAWLIYRLIRYRYALRQVIYHAHHLGINPRSKRIRGLSNLGKLETAPDSAPHQYFMLIEAEALTLETDVLNTIKEFEKMT